MTGLSQTLIGIAMVASALNAAPAPLFSVAPFAVSIESWSPEEGDKFFVDTQTNEGYLMHTDGRYIRFPVVTGQNRYVYYIGRSYFAKTPEKEWVSTSLEIKGDRITFGPSGRFLRLENEDWGRTAYGIHEYKYEDRIFESEGRYGSMGCIVVRREMMDLLVETFENNGEYLEVVTQFGLESPSEIAALFE